MCASRGRLRLPWRESRHEIARGVDSKRGSVPARACLAMSVAQGRSPDDAGQSIVVVSRRGTATILQFVALFAGGRIAGRAAPPPPGRSAEGELEKRYKWAAASTPRRTTPTTTAATTGAVHSLCPDEGTDPPTMHVQQSTKQCAAHVGRRFVLVYWSRGCPSCRWRLRPRVPSARATSTQSLAVNAEVRYSATQLPGVIHASLHAIGRRLRRRCEP